MAPPPKIEGTIDLSGITLADLAAAAREILSKADDTQALSSVVGPVRITIREKINTITDLLRHEKHTTFRSLLNAKQNRLEIVVTFLAILELIKRHLVRVSQEGLFGDIAIEVSEGWLMDEEIDIEFDE